MAYQDWVSLLNDGLQANAAGAVLNTAATATISPVGGTSAFGTPPAGSSPPSRRPAR